MRWPRIVLPMVLGLPASEGRSERERTACAARGAGRGARGAARGTRRREGAAPRRRRAARASGRPHRRSSFTHLKARWTLGQPLVEGDRIRGDCTTILLELSRKGKERKSRGDLPAALRGPNGVPAAFSSAGSGGGCAPSPCFRRDCDDGTRPGPLEKDDLTCAGSWKLEAGSGSRVFHRERGGDSGCRRPTTRRSYRNIGC